MALCVRTNEREEGECMSESEKESGLTIIQKYTYIHLHNSTYLYMYSTCTYVLGVT